MLVARSQNRTPLPVARSLVTRVHHKPIDRNIQRRRPIQGAPRRRRRQLRDRIQPAIHRDVELLNRPLRARPQLAQHEPPVRLAPIHLLEYGVPELRCRRGDLAQMVNPRKPAPRAAGVVDLIEPDNRKIHVPRNELHNLGVGAVRVDTPTGFDDRQADRLQQRGHTRVVVVHLQEHRHRRRVLQIRNLFVRIPIDPAVDERGHVARFADRHSRLDPLGHRPPSNPNMLRHNAAPADLECGSQDVQVATCCFGISGAHRGQRGRRVFLSEFQNTPVRHRCGDDLRN
ncbi:Uncharacterised protein [Mycobacteroides abscessus subsp. bolletii]|nr:Uncharacterised protein [Mycobacteroides abscessus subsp. bolletii]